MKTVKLLFAMFLLGAFSVHIQAQEAAKTCTKSVTIVKQHACIQDLMVMRMSEITEYPEDARAMGVEGEVKLTITTDQNGRVLNVNVIDGADRELSDAVLAAANSMLLEFEQEALMGSYTYKIPVKFSLIE
ncbi:MAG: TonB family protein [Weeksellaceae bacterium]|nr:TonB family protein [Weeksellaceae bacterium]